MQASTEMQSMSFLEINSTKLTLKIQMANVRWNKHNHNHARTHK